MIGNNTFIAGHRATGTVSAWFRAPVVADGDLGDGARVGVRAAGRGRHGDRGVDARPHVCDRRRRRSTCSCGIRRPAARWRRCRARARCRQLVLTPRSDGAVRGARGRRDRSVRAGQSASRRSAAHAVRQGLVRGLRRSPSTSGSRPGATDDFEPKISLVPLIFGTIKGTFYALIFAIPLAVLGALYTSQFVHPTIRARIKPTVEIMAALPSVVIGFVAGLYLGAGRRAQPRRRDAAGRRAAALRHVGLSRLERAAARAAAPA